MTGKHERFVCAVCGGCPEPGTLHYVGLKKKGLVDTYVACNKCGLWTGYFTRDSELDSHTQIHRECWDAWDRWEVRPILGNIYAEHLRREAEMKIKWGIDKPPKDGGGATEGIPVAFGANTREAERVKRLELELSEVRTRVGQLEAAMILHNYYRGQEESNNADSYQGP